MPVADEALLLGDVMRGVRFPMEFAEADGTLRAWSIVSTSAARGSLRALLETECPVLRGPPARRPDLVRGRCAPQFDVR